MLPRKTSLAILSAALMLGILAKAKVLHEFDFASVADFQPRDPGPPEPMLKHPYRGDDPLRAEGNDTAPGPTVERKPVRVEDSTHQMYPFYHALELAESKQGVARILHYGDSPTTADSITADVRSLLQERFGDAGHGFVLIAKPWPW